MKLTEVRNSFIDEVIKEIDAPDIKIERAWEILERTNAAKLLGSKLYKYVEARCVQLAQEQMELPLDQAIQVVAAKVVQFEFNLGIAWPEDKPRLNPADKSTGIVTIEATNASFLAWERKMSDERKTWDIEKKRKLWGLLRPMYEVACELKEEIGE
jgi:hypothetical protein